jgi:hypothetical protein
MLDLPIGHVWRGYGSALFLELGSLTPRFLANGRRMRNDCGEFTAGIEWSWRIEDANRILAGSWSEESHWDTFFRQVLGTTLVGISLFARIPEIELDLSNGLHLCSMMTAEGDPAWHISNHIDAHKSISVSIHDGILCWESSMGGIKVKGE